MSRLNQRGRPKKQTGNINKAAIMTNAQLMIKTEGLEKLTFRALAAKLGVTAMAIKYHVGSREELLCDLVADAFKGIEANIQCSSPYTELKHYLAQYSGYALQNASLVRFMLGNPDFIPKILHEYTSHIRQRTQAINNGDPEDVLLNLLIDYIHGFILSAEAAPSNIKLTLKISRVL